MNLPILNREYRHPDDGWYHIEAKGEHLYRTHNLVQVIDDEAVASMVNRFNRAAADPNFPGMLVDIEHFSHDMDRETRAYGWLHELQAREDGLYGRIRWTNTGKAAVDGGDYRFFSTEYDSRQAKLLTDGEVPRYRPIELDGLTLTNRPNNKGQRPITNRKESRQGAGAPLADNPKRTDTMKQIATKLGLSAEASEDAILAEVTTILNRAAEAEKAVEPLRNRVTELETANTSLLEAQVETDLDRFQNRFKPEAKDAWKKRLLTNREDTIEILESLPEPADAGQPAPGQRILNRSQAGTPKPAKEGTATAADEVSRVREAEAAIEDYRLHNKCSYHQARTAVRSRKPELFGIPTT